jgi:tight adherence protein B
LNFDSVTIILLVVLLSSVTGVILAGVWVLRHRSGSQKQSRINRFVAPSLEESVVRTGRDSLLPSQKDIGKFRDWINASMGSVSSIKLKIKLSSAYWAITDTEFILIRVGATIVSLLLGWLIFGNILAGLFMSVIAIMVPPILLDRAIAKRQHKFQDQLLDVLILVKGAVQAGYSLMQALDLAVNEIPAPASEEFGRVLHEIRLGITMEDALLNLAERMESDDLQIVITAIIINTQVGGNLSTVLESTIDTIRDRMQLFAEIRSLTSYSRYVGNFLTLMPFVAGLAIFILSPGYFDNVKTSIITQLVLLVALFGVIIGNVWIRSIVKIKV